MQPQPARCGSRLGLHMAVQRQRYGVAVGWIWTLVKLRLRCCSCSDTRSLARSSGGGVRDGAGAGADRFVAAIPTWTVVNGGGKRGQDCAGRFAGDADGDRVVRRIEVGTREQ